MTPNNACDYMYLVFQASIVKTRMHFASNTSYTFINKYNQSIV